MLCCSYIAEDFSTRECCKFVSVPCSEIRKLEMVGTLATVTNDWTQHKELIVVEHKIIFKTSK